MENLNSNVFQKVGSGYNWVYHTAGHIIEARVSRIRESSNRLTSEIAILVDNRPIARSNPVLTSVSGLDAFWRKLARRIPPDKYEIDWEAYVEQLAARVIDSHREGEPEIKIGDISIPDNVYWRIEPLLLADQANVIFGPGGSGKSFIALWLSVLMDSEYIDTAHEITVTPGRVLYLDWETDSVEIASRVRALQVGMGLENYQSQILYRRCTLSLANEADRIKDIVDSNDVKMIVVDSLGLATGGGLDEANAVLDYFAALRWIGGTSLTITHTNKEGHIFGSVYTLNCGRSIWEVQRSELNSDEESIDIGMFHKKVNVVSKQDPRGFEINFADNMVTITAKDAMDIDIVTEKQSVPQLVYQIVQREGPLSRGELLNRISDFKEEPPNKLKGAVRTAISRAITKGSIVEIDDKLVIQTKFSDQQEGDQWKV